MSDTSIVLPSKPRIIYEKENTGVYEIDGLYPGYGHTLGNSLRRIILSSLPGAAITNVKIEGVGHEFSTISGVKEDVINILLNLKKTRFSLSADEPVKIYLEAKGVKEVKAKDFEVPGQVKVLTPDQHILSITDKNTHFKMEAEIQQGLGFMPKEVLQKDKVDIGSIAVDAIFTPIKRVNYEVENMRVGNRTDFNRLRIFIETDGTLSPKEALEKSIAIMISQLRAIVGFQEEALPEEEKEEAIKEIEVKPTSLPVAKKEFDSEFLKTRIESLGFSARTTNALVNANIRTLGGLVRKKEEDILDIDGLGTKGVQEIKKILSGLGVNLK
jgi:DNA-directed RNA polymerase subunit alpha